MSQKFNEKFDGKIFKVGTQIIENPLTKKSMETTLIKSPHWVQCLAITKSLKVVLVRQFRFGINKLTLELPGGILDNCNFAATGFAIRDNALRELEEETGYVGTDSNVIYQTSIHANPAFMNNSVYGVCVVDVDDQLVETKFDENEFCNTKLISLHELPLFIDFIDNPYSSLLIYRFMDFLKFNKKDPICKPLWKEIKRGNKELKSKP